MFGGYRGGYMEACCKLAEEQAALSIGVSGRMIFRGPSLWKQKVF